MQVQDLHIQANHIHCKAEILRYLNENLAKGLSWISEDMGSQVRTGEKSQCLALCVRIASSLQFEYCFNGSDASEP